MFFAIIFLHFVKTSSFSLSLSLIVPVEVEVRKFQMKKERKKIKINLFSTGELSHKPNCTARRETIKWLSRTTHDYSKSEQSARGEENGEASASWRCSTLSTGSMNARMPLSHTTLSLAWAPDSDSENNGLFLLDGLGNFSSVVA